MDVVFDMDLQKILIKILKARMGVMIIVVCSSTEGGLKCFAEAVNSIEGKYRRNLHLALCGKVEKNTKIKAGLKTQDIETVLQWSQTTFESSVG